MNRRMLFKIGVTLVIGVGVILFYLVNVQEMERSAVTKIHQNSEKIRILHYDFHQERAGQSVDIHEDSLQFESQRNNLLQQPPDDDGDTNNVGDDGFQQQPNRSSQSSFRQTEKLPPENSSGRQEQKFSFLEKGLDPVLQSREQPGGDAIHLCVVVCGDRTEETMTMLKSAAMVTPYNIPLVFHLITEPQHHQFFQNQLELWPKFYTQRVFYNIYNVTFPGGTTSDAWRKLFKPCASQRLFLPDLLRSVDSLIYVDTDTLFMHSLSDLWSFFSLFNETQLAGLVSEAEDGTAGWYNRFATHPYYGDFGVNSGVMLMNLTRLRRTSWLTDMQTFYNQYRLTIPWGDQDLINIFFSAHSDQLYLMPCPWNYRSDHCKYMSNCKLAEQEGVSVLHGSRRMFYADNEPAFAAVFDTFRKYRLGDDLRYHFLEVLREALSAAKPSNCGKVSNIFFLQLQKLLERNEELHAQTDGVTNTLEPEDKDMNAKFAEQNIKENSWSFLEASQGSNTFSNQAREVKGNNPNLQQEQPELFARSDPFNQNDQGEQLNQGYRDQVVGSEQRYNISNGAERPTSIPNVNELDLELKSQQSNNVNPTAQSNIQNGRTYRKSEYIRLTNARRMDSEYDNYDDDEDKIENAGKMNVEESDWQQKK